MPDKKHLITQDILSATRWFLEAPSVVIKTERGGDGTKTWKDKALEDLKNKVNRVKGEFPLEALYGVTFEDKVYKTCLAGVSQGSQHFQFVCDKVRGFSFFEKGKANLDVDGMPCFLYTKYDAIRRGENPFIRDIKTTASYKAGKYIKGIQHKLYCYVAQIPDFEYVIAEWEKYPVIKDVHIEAYHCDDMIQLEKDIIYEIRDCFGVLHDLGLWEDYRTKYCLY